MGTPVVLIVFFFLLRFRSHLLSSSPYSSQPPPFGDSDPGSHSRRIYIVYNIYIINILFIYIYINIWSTIYTSKYIIYIYIYPPYYGARLHFCREKEISISFPRRLASNRNRAYTRCQALLSAINRPFFLDDKKESLTSSGIRTHAIDLT